LGSTSLDSISELNELKLIDLTGSGIGLWGPNVTLRFRFDVNSFRTIRNGANILKLVRNTFYNAIQLWGSAAPVSFEEVQQDSDFIISMSPYRNCSPRSGCTLASAFFPDVGDRIIRIFPNFITDNPNADAATTVMAHELGHVFGLHHWFLKSNRQVRVEIFGRDRDPVTIMNYGEYTKNDFRRSR